MTTMFWIAARPTAPPSAPPLPVALVELALLVVVEPPPVLPLVLVPVEEVAGPPDDPQATGESASAGRITVHTGAVRRLLSVEIIAKRPFWGRARTTARGPPWPTAC